MIAFIPVRGGSKGIPKKNIKPIGGRPLLYWVLEAATGCSHIDRVYVSTDDEEIAECTRAFRNYKVTVIPRGSETATDTASTESAMLEFARATDFDAIVLIQATSPLLQREHLEEAIERYNASGADSMLSAVKQNRFIWEQEINRATPLNYDPMERPLRQSFRGYFVENGAFYITGREALLKSGCRLSGSTILYEMPEETYYELDELADWAIVEALLQRRRITTMRQNAFSCSDVKLFATDVDGVLTDAGMYYSDNGEELKKFNTRDGKAFELLRQRGILTAIITSEDTRIVENRARKLRIDHVLQGVTRKSDALRDLCAKLGFELSDVVYVGDDINDLDVFPIVGFSACPADGLREVKEAARYVCSRRGGEGCVREVVEMLLKQLRGEVGVKGV